MANSAARSIDVGSLIADTYIIDSLIGRGGMGSVYLASHTRLPGKQVAIKILHGDLVDPEAIGRFKHEAEIASRLNHPNIVTVHDFNVTTDGVPYLVLEYLQGESLAQRLQNGPLALDSVFSIARQVGSALAAAHREGIVHRDLKPPNIFLVPTEIDGKAVELVKVLDFGISKVRGSSTVKTLENALLGTPQYMAPEQARTEHESIDARTDVFALGAIVYEMLAGHPAFTGETIPEVVYKVVHEQPAPLATEAPSVPPNVVAVVNQAMAKAAAERFSSVSTFVEKLTGDRPVLRPSIPPPANGEVAFARTMSTADHSLDETLAPPSLHPKRAQTPTVESLAPPPRPLPPPSASPTIASPPTIAPHRARNRLAIPAIVIASALVGALVLYLVLRGGEQRAAGPAIASGSAPTELAATPDAADSPVADAAIAEAPDAAAPPDAAPVKPTPTPTPPPTPTPTRPERTPVPENYGTAAPLLQRASHAFARGNYKRAEKLASEVINGTGTNRVAKVRALSLRGAISCVAHDDQEHAQSSLRQIRRLGGGAAAIRFVRTSCRRAGYEVQ